MDIDIEIPELKFDDSHILNIKKSLDNILSKIYNEYSITKSQYDERRGTNKRATD